MNATIVCLMLIFMIAVLAFLLFRQECYINELEEELELKTMQMKRLFSRHADDPLWRRAHDDE
ncbi:MAG: hypothetical protein IKF61_02985 [Firmicutes bacterium]|nr:hypothetical protein [Bacillota bacterium]